MARVLQKHKVVLSHPFTSAKCAFAERVIYTWSRLLYKFLALHKTQRYIDVLPSLVQSYNRRIHSSLPEDLSPAQAELPSMQGLLEKHHRAKIAGENAFVRMRKTKPLAIGTRVRISIRPEPFQQKPYVYNWSDELYSVTKVITHRPRSG